MHEVRDIGRTLLLFDAEIKWTNVSFQLDGKLLLVCILL